MVHYWFLYGSTPRHEWNKKQFRVANEKGLPIPGTGNRRRFRGYFRHPHHMNIDRERCNEYEHKFKRLHDVPNAWDDVNRGDWNNKNWKHYRNHQWK